MSIKIYIQASFIGVLFSRYLWLSAESIAQRYPSQETIREKPRAVQNL